MASAGSSRDARIAGAIPKTIPAASDTSTPNTTTSQSTRISSRRGSEGGASATSPRLPAQASARPATPPMIESVTASVNNCVTSRRRGAPSAMRRLISRRRASPRESSRLATLAHTIRSTTPTALSKAIRNGRAEPTSWSRSWWISGTSGAAMLNWPGCSRMICRARALASLKAWSRVNPSRRRATRFK